MKKLFIKLLLVSCVCVAFCSCLPPDDYYYIEEYEFVSDSALRATYQDIRIEIVGNDSKLSEYLYHNAYMPDELDMDTIPNVKWERTFDFEESHTIKGRGVVLHLNILHGYSKHPLELVVTSEGFYFKKHIAEKKKVPFYYLDNYLLPYIDEVRLILDDTTVAIWTKDNIDAYKNVLNRANWKTVWKENTSNETNPYFRGFEYCLTKDAVDNLLILGEQ